MNFALKNTALRRIFKPSKIGIAYTTVTDDELPIQVDVNLENFTVEKYIDNVLVDTEYYYNLSNITEKFLQNLNFDELIYVTTTN